MEELYKEILKYLHDIPTHVTGIFTAMIIAFLRILLDRKETTWIRIALESCLCGALVVPISYGIRAIGWSPDFAVFCGGVIGYFGPTVTRIYVLKFINKQLEKKQ